MHDIGITLATGPRTCGKTKLLKLIAKLANSGPIVFADTSEILDLHVEKGTPVGQKLAEYKSDRAAGKILPDDIAFEAVKQWITAKCERQQVHHVLIAGSPRGVNQSELWHNYGRNKLRVLHIPTTREQIREGVARRQNENGEVREDENEAAIETAWSEYQNKVLPGLSVFNGHVLDLPRSLPMRHRLEKAIGHMVLPDQVRFRWLRRLETLNHPVSIEVDQLDGVVRR